MEWIYYPNAPGHPRDFIGLPIRHYNCDDHEQTLMIAFKIEEQTEKEILSCMDCKKIKEAQEKLDKEVAEYEHKIRNYEKERKNRSARKNRISCLLHFGHTYEVVGMSVCEVGVNAGSWSVDVNTYIVDCRRCGKRIFRRDVPPSLRNAEKATKKSGANFIS